MADDDQQRGAYDIRTAFNLPGGDEIGRATFSRYDEHFRGEGVAPVTKLPPGTKVSWAGTSVAFMGLALALGVESRAEAVEKIAVQRAAGIWVSGVPVDFEPDLAEAAKRYCTEDEHYHLVTDETGGRRWEKHRKSEGAPWEQ